MSEQNKKVVAIAMMLVGALAVGALAIYMLHSPSESNAPRLAELVSPPSQIPATAVRVPTPSPSSTVRPPTAIDTMPQLITLPAGITRPPLEIERARNETRLTTAGGTGPTGSAITIATGFEAATEMPVREISPTHFAIEVSTDQWCMFSVHGVLGKTVRFDIVSPTVSLHYWATMNPVFSYRTNLSDPATYAVDDTTEAPTDPARQRAWNGAVLPSTAGQQWHYIADAWQPQVQQLSFVQKFDQNDAIIATRVPVPPSYWQTEMRSLGQQPSSTLVELGNSQGGLPLLLLKIGNGGDDAERKKPCIAIYAGEHAVCPDSMLAALGAAEFLLDGKPQAMDLCDRYTFIILPMVDPDATATARHDGIAYGFMKENKQPENVAYANWFKQWVDAGKRLDVVYDLDNVQSKENPNISCPELEGAGERGVRAEALDLTVLGDCSEAGLDVAKKPWMHGWSPDRLGGWLDQRYGAFSIAYELNSQWADRHLNMEQVKGIGRILVTASAKFLATPDGTAALRNVDARRQERLDRVAKAGTIAPGTDAIDAESTISPGSPAWRLTGRGDGEQWVP